MRGVKLWDSPVNLSINQEGMATPQEHRLGNPVPNVKFSKTQRFSFTDTVNSSNRMDVTPLFVRQRAKNIFTCEIYSFLVLNSTRILKFDPFLNSTPDRNGKEQRLVIHRNTIT